MFTLKFETDNAAFDEDHRQETARILREIAREIEGGLNDGPVRDINGNKIGGVHLDLPG